MADSVVVGAAGAGRQGEDLAIGVCVFSPHKRNVLADLESGLAADDQGEFLFFCLAFLTSALVGLVGVLRHGSGVASSGFCVANVFCY